MFGKPPCKPTCFSYLNFEFLIYHIDNIWSGSRLVNVDGERCLAATNEADFFLLFDCLCVVSKWNVIHAVVATLVAGAAAAASRITTQTTPVATAATATATTTNRHIPWQILRVCIYASTRHRFSIVGGFGFSARLHSLLPKLCTFRHKTCIIFTLNAYCICTMNFSWLFNSKIRDYLYVKYALFSIFFFSFY